MSKISFSNRIAAKLAGLRRRMQASAARRLAVQHTPELLKAYAAFERATQSGVARQPHKGWDLWQSLLRYQPRSIVELGSGTTSAVFALYAQKHGCKYVCFEHSQGWAKVTEDCLREAGLLNGESPIKVVPSSAHGEKGVGFVEAIPGDADFIYVDGPPCHTDSGKKLPNDDVSRALDRGELPRVIIVDGRLDTVDLIRSHSAMTHYHFLPGYHYSLLRGRWADVLAGREHTVFSLPTA